MTAGERIILNTIATYGRTVLSIVLGLFSGRWILHALGNIDYGLMGVVGGLIVFATVLSGVSSGACIRFFALSIGQGNKEETREWFKVARTIHIILPITVLIIFYPIGEWVVHHVLNIPPDRMITALWVFRISVLNAFVSMVTAPYIGMWTAKQMIAEMSLWTIVQTLISFIIAYYLLHYKGDTWLFWSIATTFINISYLGLLVLRGIHLFPECQGRITLKCDKSRIIKLLSFAGWQLWGGLTGIFRGNLLAILLNKYFAPVKYPEVNSSYSIGNLLSAHSQSLSLAMLGAFTPEITSTEGRGEREKMFLLANRASKYGVILALLVVVPLSLEVNTVLTIWLKNPPKYASVFCLFFLAQMIADKITYGQLIAVNAVGRIALYQCIIGGILLCALPITWLCFALKCSVISLGWVLLGTMITASAVRALLAKYIVGFPVRQWINTVVIPTGILAILAFGTGYLFTQLFLNNIWRVLGTSILTTAVTLLMLWTVLLDQEEKLLVITQIDKLKTKIFHQSSK